MKGLIAACTGRWRGPLARGSHLALPLAVLALVALAAPVAHAQPPTASFTASPGSPLTSEAVTFTSTSTGADGNRLAYAWELDGVDDDFDEAFGPTAQWEFPWPGRYTVRLRVSEGSTQAISSMTITVRNRPPVADFTFFPASPQEGDVLDLVTLSHDPDGHIVEQAWDLDGDGQFDDGSGPTVKVSFFRFKGTRSIRLLVRDDGGETDEHVRTVTFAPALGPLLSPFPVVRMIGRAMGRTTLIRRLSVRAPVGSKIVVRCQGGSCPAGRLAGRARGKVVRFRRLERRLAPGALIRVFVTKRRRVGKYTQFKIRSGRPPLRRDRCAVPDSTRPIACPRG